MKKSEMTLLERAFIAELEEAAGSSIGVMQSRSKVAAKLVEEGYLTSGKQVIGGRFPVTVQGYRLTHLGRMTYCISGSTEK